METFHHAVAGRRSRLPYRSSSFSIHWRIAALNPPSTVDQALQAKQSNAINLFQCLMKLFPCCIAQSLFEQTKDIVFGAAFRCVKKWKTKFFPIFGIEALQKLMLVRIEIVQPSPRLLF